MSAVLLLGLLGWASVNVQPAPWAEHMQNMQEHFSQMHPLAEMAAQGLLPKTPPALFAANQKKDSQPSTNGSPGILPPPLIPQSNRGPSPQFQEMLKRLEKEHNGNLPPGLGAFTAPPPNIPVEEPPRLNHAPGLIQTGAGLPPMAPPGLSDNISPTGPPEQKAGATNSEAPILPAVALPRDLPAQPKGPSIQQIIEIQKQHQDHLDKEKKKQNSKSGKTDPNDVFKSPLVDGNVDLWIDQQIAKHSQSFKHRLNRIYSKRASRKSDSGEHGLVDDYDPDGTVFLSKVSGIISSEHPDMGSRLDQWIDRQVDSALQKHSVNGHHTHSRDDDDDADVWLQDALEKSESSDESPSMSEALSRDFAKGIFFSSSKQNRREFGGGESGKLKANSESTGVRHRKFKRRRVATKSNGEQVLLQMSSSVGGINTWKSFEHGDFFGPIDHNFNWNPEDNRFRLDKDTNLQDPDYIDFPMHKIIEKHRKQGPHSRHAKRVMDKWVDIATGHNKDPLMGLSTAMFENDEDLGLDSFDEALDANTLLDKAEKHMTGNRGEKQKRSSDAWGD